MRELVRVSDVGQRVQLTSALVGSNWTRTLSAGDIVGPGDVSGPSTDPEERRYLIRAVRYRDRRTLVACRIRQEHAGQEARSIYKDYQGVSGDLLLPGPARWAMNEATAAKGLIHFGKPHCVDFLDAVLVQLRVGPKTSALRPVPFIDETVPVGEYPSYTTDAALTIHDFVASKDAAVVETDDPRTMQILGASWVAAYCDRIHDTLDNQERLLTRLFLTPEADRDEIARALKEVFGFGNLRDLTRYLQLGKKRARPDSKKEKDNVE